MQSSLERTDLGFTASAFLGYYSLYLPLILQSNLHSGTVPSAVDVCRQHDSGVCSLSNRSFERLPDTRQSHCVYISTRVAARESERYTSYCISPKEVSDGL